MNFPVWWYISLKIYYFYIKLSKEAKIRHGGYQIWIQAQTQNKAKWLAACGHVSASSQSLRLILILRMKVSKGAKIRNRYNQIPHLTQDTNGKVTNSHLDATNESQEVSPFPEGDHKAQINRRAQRHSKHKTEQKHKISTKEGPPWNGQ